MSNQTPTSAEWQRELAIREQWRKEVLARIDLAARKADNINAMATNSRSQADSLSPALQRTLAPLRGLLGL